MSDSDWRVLVPVEVLEGETVSEAVIEALSTLPVVVLGYHVLPEQTAPGQARLQFEDQAQEKLEILASSFREAGGGADTRLVFTHDEEQTIDRVADETGCNAVLIPNPSGEIERLLVPLRGEVDVDRITAFVAALVGDRDIGVTLFHVAEGGEVTSEGQSLVDDGAARLRELGVDGVETAMTTAETPRQAIAMAAVDHDAVVMGESEPSLRSFLFGEPAEQVAAQSLGPVVVVRRPREGDENSDSAD